MRVIPRWLPAVRRVEGNKVRPGLARGEEVGGEAGAAVQAASAGGEEGQSAVGLVR